ncbi:hypothetical protein BDN72DRAFT_829922 [Pluteus cervinus]|uniref:Uncharacterized protein n=1 Tax=Pluteus cervinus TaxID=181527 RepID=A0ACD3BG86_9AGAR|nr:hypothetical protein BDN72DRAFT_829922 [Pluteus cervinus]
MRVPARRPYCPCDVLALGNLRLPSPPNFWLKENEVARLTLPKLECIRRIRTCPSQQTSSIEFLEFNPESGVSTALLVSRCGESAGAGDDDDTSCKETACFVIESKIVYAGNGTHVGGLDSKKERHGKIGSIAGRGPALQAFERSLEYRT